MYQLVFVQKNKFIYKTTELIMLITSFSFVASVWISAVVKCDKLSQLFYQMIDFDKNLDRFGITICYEKQRKADVIELIVRHVVLIFIIVYYFVMGVYICQHDIYTEFVRLPLLVIKSAFCHQTIGLISMIKARFLVFEQTNDPFNRPNAKNKRTTATDNFVQNMRLAPQPLSLDQTLQRRIRSVVVGFLRDELHGDRYIVVLFFGRRPGGGNRVETLKSVVDLRRIFHRRRLLSVQRLLQDDRRGASILLRGRIKPCAF
jgi:hypothetical protein